MRAYSLDLRARVATACGAPGHSVGRVAAQFRGSVSLVAKLLHRHRTSGSRAASPLRGGPAPCPDAFARAGLVACQRPQPGATLEELRAWLAALGGPAVSQATLGRAVQTLDGRRKKRASTPPGATPAA